MHARDLKKHGETDERVFAVAAWRDTPYFTDAERAALALTEELTRIADRPEAVSDELWARGFVALQRGAAVRVADHDRPDQRVEPAQREHASGRWGVLSRLGQFVRIGGVRSRRLSPLVLTGGDPRDRGRSGLHRHGTAHDRCPEKPERRSARADSVRETVAPREEVRPMKAVRIWALPLFVMVGD